MRSRGLMSGLVSVLSDRRSRRLMSGSVSVLSDRRSRGLMSGSVSVLSDFVQTELRMCVIRCMCGFTLTTTKKQKNGFTAVPLYQHGFLHISTGSCRSTQVSPGQPGFLQVGWAVNRSVENSHHSLSPLSSSP